MATKKKLLQAAAGNAGGAGLNVEEVFSTYLYTGNGSTQTITNGIDLDGEGGLVWIKDRNYGNNHFLWDTNRGVQKGLITSTALAEQNEPNGLTAFNSNGFSVGSSNGVNPNTYNMASWTFRQAPKFFDVVTYTGDGNASQALSHNLGAAVGCIIVKRTDSTSDWLVYHRSLTYANGTGAYQTTSAGQNVLRLNKTNNVNDSATYWNNTDATSTNFTVGSEINVSNASYVAYLFAHNNGDGEFGPDADQDGVKCSHYVGDGTNDFSKEINVGFEPQFVIVKKTSQSTDTTGWGIADAMRGFNTGNTNWLIANTSAVESTLGGEYIELTSTGFKVGTTTWNSNTAGYIYIAIRRGTKVPESATEVFAMDLTGSSEAAGTQKTTGFPVDFQVVKLTSGSHSYAMDRLRGVSSTTTESGPYLYLSSTTDEAGTTLTRKWDNTGYQITSIFGNNPYMFWNWKRASKYFDVVAYQGTGIPGFTFNHNLGVVPEMIWVKNRGASEYWAVYHKDLNGGTNPSHYYLKLNDTNAETDYNEIWNDTEPTATQVTVGQQGVVNSSSFSHIAYLFATLAGISKVGSVTHSGTTNVDCGFTSGARFVLLKRTDATGGWYVWDSTRGIVSGNDPYFLLNANAAQVTNTDYIDPLSSGFTITSSFTAGDYIFYAIA